MPKIHELLAAETDRKEIANKLLGEGIQTFANRADHFQGHIKTVTMYDQERQVENTTDHKEVVETVSGKLEWVWDAQIRALDTFASKEASNCSSDAVASVVIDDVQVLADLPATVLLGLERRLGRIRELYQAIPTLNPGSLWVLDENHELDNVYRTDHPTETHKTEKVLEHKVLYEATDKHPAQIEKYSVDRNVGKIVHVAQSSMVSPARKAIWLQRISSLEIAVKEARQRANNAEVIPIEIGERIQNYIHNLD